MTETEKTGLWRKAAVLGSLWAASEIVLGSFIHNAHIPLGGILLTGIGISILVAGHRLRPQQGLFWRAGLVCAAMKSVSPSAVLFGPMLAISFEGFLLEAGVFMAGINPLGYLLGGGLAMSWALFHKIGRTFMIYGPETFTIYTRGLEHLQAWAGYSFGGPWPPLILFWAAHFLAGSLAAVIGLRAGPAHSPDIPAGRDNFVPRHQSDRSLFTPPKIQRAPLQRKFSLTALILHLLFIAAILSLGSRLTAWDFAGAAAVYAAVCISTYSRAISIIKRFGLWSGILIASLLAGLLLGRWESGVQMGLRALILTLGFSCIGEELKNPVFHAWMKRYGSRVFFNALEQAF
ncbi:MAG: hypothetical protein ABIG11_04010, partial [bacterium]